MSACKTCRAPLSEQGFTTCLAINCPHDIRLFEAEVEKAKAALSLPLLDAISQNKMPECFTPTRASMVAMSQLLMTALHQSEELIKLRRV